MDGRGRIKELLNRTKGYWSIGILHQAQGAAQEPVDWQGGSPGAVSGAGVMGWNVGARGEVGRGMV